VVSAAGTRSDELLTEVVAMLGDAGVKRSWQADGVEKFARLMPGLVSEARGVYLRKGPGQVFDPPSSRRRLGDPDSAKPSSWQRESDE
jgi:hypothetical protein